MPRYVILEHSPGPAGPRDLHWDLMLDWGAALRTWALEAPLTALGGAPGGVRRINARRLDDHRRAYLDYEGPVSGDRGHVRRWDRGDFAAVHSNDSELVLELRGERFAGRLRLVRDAGDAQCWTLSLVDSPSAAG